MLHKLHSATRHRLWARGRTTKPRSPAHPTAHVGVHPAHSPEGGMWGPLCAQTCASHSGPRWLRCGARRAPWPRPCACGGSGQGRSHEGLRSVLAVLMQRGQQQLPLLPAGKPQWIKGPTIAGGNQAAACAYPSSPASLRAILEMGASATFSRLNPAA